MRRELGLLSVSSAGAAKSAGGGGEINNFTIKNAQKMESETFVLTLEKVKECIGFEPGTPIYDTLNRLCDLWYAIKKKEGATDSDAAMYAMDRLGETLLNWGKEKNEQAS